MLPELMNQISPDQDIGSVTADGAYDTRKCHEAMAARNAHAVIPPRKNAKPSKPTSAGVQLAHSCASGQPIKTIAFEDAVDPSIRNFDAMVTRQIPNDPDRSQVIFAAQIQNFLDDLSWRLIGGIFRNRFGILQPSFAMLLICFAP